MVTRREGWQGGTDWEFGIDMHTLLYLKQMTNKDLLYSTGTLQKPKWEKNLKKHMGICTTQSLYCTAETHC